MAIPNTTPTPNELYNGEMNKMNDTELRVVLIVTRATLGWEINHETGMRKQEDWISQKLLMKKSGKSNRAISTAVKTCVEKNWIEARDKLGNILLTPEQRSGNKVFYRLGRIFLDKITCNDYYNKIPSESTVSFKKEIPSESKGDTSQKNSKITCEDSSQDEPVKLTTETCEVDDIKPVKQVHSTKETITKETIQKVYIPELNPLIELFQPINPSYKQLFKVVPQRNALTRLLKEHGEDKIKWVLNILPKSNSMKYAPTITTPIQLENKLGELLAFLKKEGSETRIIKL